MSADVRTARDLFPPTRDLAYFDTAAVGLASQTLARAVRDLVDEWTESALDYDRCEENAERARTAVASLIGADRADVALIASVSAAAGLVAAQFGPAARGQNVVVGEREYTSNYFPWRLLAQRGYDVRQVPFRNGGVEPDDIAPAVDGGTVLVALSGVQSSSGHRSDIRAIGALAREVGAVSFVDGSQLVGALPVAPDLAAIDVLATPDHKFLMNAGRGLGYCYFSPTVRDRFVPFNAGWKAARDPMGSFYGPRMDLSPTASRFDNSASWIAAVANDAALSTFETFGADAIYARNRELAALLRASLTDIGWPPIDLPEPNRSTIVSVPRGADAVDAADVVRALHAKNIRCSARDGNLRFSIHFYNHEDDVRRLVEALANPSI
jgi:selenocysteine lyase/cysteine desulfurase